MSLGLSNTQDDTATGGPLVSRRAVGIHDLAQSGVSGRRTVAVERCITEPARGWVGTVRPERRTMGWVQSFRWPGTMWRVQGWVFSGMVVALGILDRCDFVFWSTCFTWHSDIRWHPRQCPLQAAEPVSSHSKTSQVAGELPGDYAAVLALRTHKLCVEMCALMLPPRRSPSGHQPHQNGWTTCLTTALRSLPHTRFRNDKPKTCRITSHAQLVK